jgi:cystinosin
MFAVNEDDDDSSPTTPLLRGEETNLLEPQQDPDNVGSNSVVSAYSFSSSSPRRQRSWWSLMLSPLTDETGDAASVVTGLSTLCVVGGMIGIFIVPHDDHLHPVGYRIVSAAIGYIYFLAWSVSFYPQVLTNFRRKTTQGLSVDFCVLNVLGFWCYSAYTVLLYTSPTMRQEYRTRQHSDGIPVESNDVAFCVHALILSMITLGQIVWYNGLSTLTQLRPEILRLVFGIMVWVLLIGPILVSLGVWHGLDYLYSLSAVKVLISLVKYVPQVILNIQRQSTVGWSIWQILLDLTGGLLSDVQLVGDTWATLPPQSRTAGTVARSVLTGNPAKLALGTLSMTFDVVFLLQHYILYPSTAGINSTAVSEAEDEDYNNNDDDDDDDHDDENEASSIQARNGACPADQIPVEGP